MLCRKELETELKRLPGLVKAMMKSHSYDEVIDIVSVIKTLEWVLGDTCEHKGRCS